MKLRNRFLPISTAVLIMLFGILSTSLYSQSTNENAKQLTLGSKSLNFLVISDWGRDGINDVDKKTPGQLKVAKQFSTTANEIKASFVVTCGDNFHGKGVSSITDPLWNVNFENVYADKSLMIPWYVTLGNHDYEGNVEAELEYAKTSKRWIQPARYYTFTKKLPDSTEVLFVVLDSSPLVQEYNNAKDGHHIKGQNTALQLRWCDSVLSKSSAKWKLAFYHHPAYSASSTHGSTKEIQDTFVPLFEKYRVDACFSGHDHDLQHSRPDNSTVEYFGTGGGSDTRPAGQADFTKFSKASLGFGVVSLTQSTMRFSFVNDKGEQVYMYEIHK
jgi:predicted MPP superfamily phosphohydrolase